MSVTTRVPSRLKASEGRRMAPRKSACCARCSRSAGVLLVERVVAGHQGQDAAGLQGVEGLGEEEVMQGEALPVVVELEVGERHVADDGVDAALGQARVAEVLDADVVAGVEHAGDAAGEAVQLDADEAHARGGQGQEVADAAARLQHGRVAGHAQACEGLVHRPDDDGRGVEGGEGGALGAGVLLGREERPQLLAQRLPGRVLVAAGDRVGKDRQGHRAEAGEAGEHLRAPRGWRAAGPARWPGACGWRRGWRGPWLSRRWRRGVCGGTGCGSMAPLGRKPGGGPRC